MRGWRVGTIKTNTEDPIAIRREMREIMQNNFGVFRDQKHMEPA